MSKIISRKELGNNFKVWEQPKFDNEINVISNTDNKINTNEFVAQNTSKNNLNNSNQDTQNNQDNLKNHNDFQTSLKKKNENWRHNSSTSIHSTDKDVFSKDSFWS